MSYPPHLVDTSVLVRYANRNDAQFLIASDAIEKLHLRGAVLHVTAQNLVEFRAVATRPITANGLGMTVAQAEARITLFENLFPLLLETPDIYLNWKALVATAGTTGKQVHDARLAAVCQTHGVLQLLTFNGKHFAPFVPHIPGFTVIDPVTI